MTLKLPADPYCPTQDQIRGSLTRVRPRARATAFRHSPAYHAFPHIPRGQRPLSPLLRREIRAKERLDADPKSARCE